MCGKSVQTEESCIRPTARMQLSVSGRWRFAFAPVSAFELDASVFAFVLLQVCSANYEIRCVQKKKFTCWLQGLYEWFVS